jgi:cation diffusion facilitator CzcD-associated flavoprotein CzcO
VDKAHPRTAVIGAGISGLTAGKMLKDYGVPYTTFETSDRIGGNWAFGNPNGPSSAYRSLHIDTSRQMLSFKDFPMPAHLSSKALQNAVTLSTRSSAWIVPKYIAGRPGDTLFKTSPHIPLSWQRKAINCWPR